MLRTFLLAATAAFIVTQASCVNGGPQKREHIFTGAFIADRPSAEDMDSFEQDYGKNAFFVLVFTDWRGFADETVLRDIYARGSVPVVSWEPWYWECETDLEMQEITAGKFDDYIDEMADRLRALPGVVYMRFAHEMNGDWYPWSTALTAPEHYRAVYRYIKDRFDARGADNVRWIFSINWENIPESNDYRHAYPGDDYVDIIGIDGYNWGDTRPWSRWMGFDEMFGPIYEELVQRYGKEIIITEFGSTGSGGAKDEWIADALAAMKSMRHLKGFILFNVDKETNWLFPPGSEEARALKRALADPVFLGRDPSLELR